MMRVLVTTLFAFFLLFGSVSAEAARPQPMPFAKNAIARALGLSGDVKIQAAFAAPKVNQQLIRFSIVVPSVIPGAGAVYLGTATLAAGRDGKAKVKRMGVEMSGTGVFSGIFEPTKKASRARRVRGRRPKRGITPWGTRLK